MKPKVKTVQPAAWRIPRTVSVSAVNDLWLSDALGEEGKLSELFNALVDLARTGGIDADKLLAQAKSGGKPRSQLERAADYMRAKEAGIRFEEDVAHLVNKWLISHRQLRAVRGRIHNSGTTFVADVSIEKTTGEVVCSVVCKSSSRADRLQLGLAEAMIGHSKTGKPVVTVVPYLVEESALAAGQFKVLGYELVTVCQLIESLDRVAKPHATGKTANPITGK